MKKIFEICGAVLIFFTVLILLTFLDVYFKDSISRTIATSVIALCVVIRYYNFRVAKN